MQKVEGMSTVLQGETYILLTLSKINLKKKNWEQRSGLTIERFDSELSSLDQTGMKLFPIDKNILGK